MKSVQTEAHSDRVTRPHDSALRGYGIILLSSLLYGTYGVWSRLMGGTFQPFYQAGARSLIIVVVMLPFMRKNLRWIPSEDWWPLGIYLSFCVFTQVPIYIAFNNAPIGTAQLIFYSFFIITAYLVARIYLNERITRVKIIAMILAFVGMAIIFDASLLTFAPYGLTMAALNGVASGGEISSSKKISEKYPATLLVFLGWVATAVTHLSLSFILREHHYGLHFTRPWLWLLVYAAVNAAAFWLSIVGFKLVDASIGSLIGLMEAVFSVLFGAIFFGEALSWSVGIGGALILSAAMSPDLATTRQLTSLLPAVLRALRLARPVDPAAFTGSQQPEKEPIAPLAGKGARNRARRHRDDAPVG